jgi:NAD(P)-dependent dehydrogenase (short-subunit alcohol dehydrogenase family)
MKKLENKVAIVTGAASGMGKAISLLFAAEGSKVVAADLNQENLDLLADEIREKKGDVITVIANVAKEQDIENMVSAAINGYGGLDILVNNAGVMDRFAPVGELDNEMWEKVMSINVDGPFKAMRSALKHFMAKKSGVIINITSLGGLNGARAGAAYTASKHALVGLTKNTGYMYAKEGIRCNAIAPGGVNTNIAQSMDYTKLTPLVKERLIPGFALSPRSGDPSEIAKAALFLASDDSSFVNGEIIVVDGGWNAY